jgi:hypothetical protein
MEAGENSMICPVLNKTSHLFLGAVALSFLAACAEPVSSTAPASILPTISFQRPVSYDPPGPPSDPWGPWIVEASRRFDVPERWIREVMRQESGGRISVTSPVGAMGLMQVMPGTYRELSARYNLGSDAYHPYDNLMAGTAYLREMYDLYGTPAFLAAYNAGPRRLEEYLWNGRGLPNETRNYVARIGPRIQGANPTRRVLNEIASAADIPLNIPAGPRQINRATVLALRAQRDEAQAIVRLAEASSSAGNVAVPEAAQDTVLETEPFSVASIGNVTAPRMVVGEAPKQAVLPPTAMQLGVPDPVLRPQLRRRTEAIPVVNAPETSLFSQIPISSGRQNLRSSGLLGGQDRHSLNVPRSAHRLDGQKVAPPGSSLLSRQVLTRTTGTQTSAHGQTHSQTATKSSNPASARSAGGAHRDFLADRKHAERSR